MINGILIFAAVLILVILILVYRINGLLGIAKEDESDRGGLSNKINALLFVVFGVAGFGFFFWYSFAEKDAYMLPEAASLHGVVTDGLFWFTIAILVIAFVLTHVLILFFIAKYHYKKDRIVKFYAENSKLEMVWTILPAIVLTILIFRGFKAWTNITTIPEMKAGDKSGIVLEIVGEQFKWSIRYPGNDEVLGKHDFRKINSVNPLGIDLSDVNGVDDFLSQEIHIPVNTPVLFRIRAKDVLHSVFAPHFRVKMDAVPGMPTQFMFTPTKTTEQMRKELSTHPAYQEKDASGVARWEKFEYELACTEICGKSHYKMKNKIIVHTEADYKKWLAEQVAWSISKTDNGFEVKDNVLELVEDKDLELFNNRVKELGASKKVIVEVVEEADSVFVDETLDDLEVPSEEGEEL